MSLRRVLYWYYVVMQHLLMGLALVWIYFLFMGANEGTGLMYLLLSLGLSHFSGIMARLNGR